MCGNSCCASHGQSIFTFTYAQANTQKHSHTYSQLYVYISCLLLLAAYGFPFQHSALNIHTHTLTHTSIYIYAHSQQHFAPTDAHNFPQMHTLTYTRRHAYAHRACKRSIACNENGRNLASRLSPPPSPSLLSPPLLPTPLPSSNHAVCSIPHRQRALCACVCQCAKMLEIVPANTNTRNCNCCCCCYCNCNCGAINATHIASALTSPSTLALDALSVELDARMVATVRGRRIGKLSKQIKKETTTKYNHQQHEI